MRGIAAVFESEEIIGGSCKDVPDLRLRVYVNLCLGIMTSFRDALFA